MPVRISKSHRRKSGQIITSAPLFLRIMGPWGLWDARDLCIFAKKECV